jgi:quercetin dioxygenase-like cupin family protein
VRCSAAELLLAVALTGAMGGCGGSPAPAAAPTAEPASTAEPAPVDDRPVDSDVDPEELRIAAIERAMNQIAPAAHLCWAAGAADDYRLAGDVRVQVTFDGKAKGKAEVTADTSRDPVLTDCLARVLEAYPWPSALAGEAVELPFAFRAPSGQSVIDRRFVPRKAQRGAEIGVLLDARNTGNDRVSMLEVSLAAGAALPVARVDRDEAWYFLDAAELVGPDGTPIAVVAGDVVYLATGSYRAVKNPGAAPARWVVVAVPGGPEGSARAGALPTTLPVGAVPRSAPGPVVTRQADAKRYPRTGGATTIYLEAAATKGKPAPRVALSLLEIDAGAAVPAHRHATETELLYVMRGGGTMTVGAVELAVTATSAVQVPPGVEHSFTATEATTAIQLYAPPGPEQRFKTAR